MQTTSRALVVWCAILAFAFVNGAIRATWLIPEMGVLAGQAVSAVMLCLIILSVSWTAATWMAVPSAADALRVGLIWLALTATFEFGVGYLVTGRSWASLLEDYKGVGAVIRVPMLLTTLIAPLVAAWSRGLLRTSP